MNTQIQKELDLIKESILQVVPAEAIYLFGSHAYGTPREDSDIDIYVVIPDEYYDELTKMAGNIAEYLYKYSIFNTDFLWVKESKFLKYKNFSLFEQTICNKGILLYE